MSTNPGSTLSAMALTSLGPLDDEPELPPESPELPGDWKGDPLPLNGLDPLLRGNWLLFDDWADGICVPLFQVAWPMPMPAASTTSAAPPAMRPFRSRLSRCPVGPAA